MDEDEKHKIPLEPESEISIETVKSRSIRGVIILTGRTFILQLIGIGAQLLLLGYLGRYEFGVFAIVNAIIGFLVYFSDVGLAAALIQKKEKPTEADLKTTFLVQQVLVFAIIGVVISLTPFFKVKYSLTGDATLLLYALALSLFLSSLKTIPSVLLERKLDFVKLAMPQILENVIYSVVLVGLAMTHHGISSFTYAIIIRDIVGLVAIYILQPWKPGFAFSRTSLSGLFKFGVPYQINTLLANFKDNGIVILLGSILGTGGVGVLSTAQNIGRYPLTFFMDNVTRVTFPAFSRLQEVKDQLERTVTRSIFFICFLVFPSLTGLVILAPIITKIIPAYNHWEGALVPLAFVAINYGFAAATTQLTNLLNAIGKIKNTFYLMIMWTVLTWVLVPALAIKYGVNGAAAGYALVGASSIVAILFAKRYVNFSLTDSIFKPLISTVIMGIVMLMLKSFTNPSFTSLGLIFVIGTIIYFVSSYLIIGKSLLVDISSSLGHIFAKKGVV